MLTRTDIVRQRENILLIGAKYGIQAISLFGSVARGSASEQSDLDLLVSASEGTSLLSLGGFQVEVERLLGRKVDVVTWNGLRPRIRERVTKEAVAL